MNRILRAIKKVLQFCIANTIGRLFYKSKYMKGKYFESLKSMGWGWISRGIFFQKILGYNRAVPWPVSEKIFVGNYKNINFNVDDLHIFQVFGNYYQAWDAKIFIGKGTYIAPNVGIITSNHNIRDLEKRAEGRDIVIGDNSWIGMNSVILPGVKLGARTIVGAGSVVTKSFMQGNCVIAGNPAKKIKKIEENNYDENLENDKK